MGGLVLGWSAASHLVIIQPVPSCIYSPLRLVGGLCVFIVPSYWPVGLDFDRWLDIFRNNIHHHYMHSHVSIHSNQVFNYVCILYIQF